MKGPPEWYGPETWNVYLVLCNDGTLYCGVAKHVDERIQTHNAGRGAKYTKGRRPVRLVWVSPMVEQQGEALRLERWVKSLTRAEKWHLIRGDSK